MKNKFGLVGLGVGRPLFAKDGGHGMIFRTFDGSFLLTLHQPNSGRKERPRLFRVKEENGRLALGAFQGE